MDANSANCAAIRKLWLEEATGRALTPSERALADEHLKECRHCRLEVEAAAAVRFDGTSGPAPRLDDIARRRWVDEVLTRTEAAVGESAVVERQREQAGVAIYTRRFSAIAAAIAAIAAGVVAWLTLSKTGTVPSNPPPVEEAAIAIEGQALLIAGAVRFDGKPATGLVRITAGATATVGTGRAVLELPAGVILLADAGSQLQIAVLNSRAIDIRLDRGRMLVEVDPDRQGPPLAVGTREGRVVVTGTAFSVEATADQVRVQVFRGGVRLEGESVAARSVRVGETATLGQVGVSRLSSDEQAEAGEVLRAFDMLTGEDPTRLNVQSLPAGATVVVDGISLGHTPLEVAIRSGHRNLEIAMDGYESVRELLDLAPGKQASRVFDLRGSAAATTSVEQASSSPDRVLRPSRPAEVADNDASAPLGPAELLERAQAFRIARDWANAVAAYEELIKQYPQSAQARSSRVSIGNIQLDHLHRPASALASFNEYLLGGQKGSLAQEAAFGRAQALRVLGRTAQEERALEEFLVDFPSAIQADRVRERLAELK